MQDVAFLALIRFDVDEREESIWAWAVSLVLLSYCKEKEVESTAKTLDYRDYITYRL